MTEERFDIYEAMVSPRGFLPFFKNGLESWASWLVFFKVLAGRTDLSADEMELLSIATGLDALPTERLKECYLCCGRRSGKSTACALLAVYYGLWGGWDKDLQAGEKPQIFIISPTLVQGKIIMGYVKAILAMKHLKSFVRREQQESVELINGTTISIKPASWRSTRGWSVGLILMEELAFWRFETESANVDTEIYAALKPSTANIKNSLVVGISTPFIRQGLLWTKAANWGRSGPVIFWRAPSWAMNRLLDEDELRKEYETLSEAEFNSEFGAEEREDIEQFLPQELIDRAIVAGRTVLPADHGLSYVAFCDASEGLRKNADSMTFALAHAAGEKFIVDVLLEFKPPFAPKVVIQAIAESCKAYRVSTITQDRHAIAWIADDFKPYDIAVETSALTKSEIYAQFAILASKGVVELPDNDRLRVQLQGLQKFLGGGGTIKIDHLANGHDDICNSACGAAVLVARPREEGYACFSKESFY
jgi:hypothetical protein